MIGGMVSRVTPVRMAGLLLTFALVGAACTTEQAAPTTTGATTSTSSTSTTTSAVVETTSTTSMDQRIAEVTEIVRQVDFGWFDAIYRKDEAALADVVAVQESFDTRCRVDGRQFVLCRRADPGREPVIEVQELLIDRVDC